MSKPAKRSRLTSAAFRRGAGLLSALFVFAQVLVPPLHALAATAATPARAELGHASSERAPSLLPDRASAEAGHQEGSCTVCKILRQASAADHGASGWCFQLSPRRASTSLSRSAASAAALAKPRSRAPPVRT